MSTVNNNKGLLILVVLLVITNVAMLWYFTRPAKEEKQLTRSERMAEYVKKELRFDDAQAQQYLQLRRLRDSLLAPLQADSRAAKMEMMALLQQQNVPDSVVRQAAEKVAQKQVALEVEYHNHFRRLMNICSPEQKPLMDDLLNRMVRRNTGDTTVQTNNN
jgi:Spy/CpxP family protein refolding chaperone